MILFRMLTGRLPFESGSAVELMLRHAREEAPPVSDLRPDAPERLQALTASALAKDARARPEDGAALMAALSGGDVPAPVTTEVTAVLGPSETKTLLPVSRWPSGRRRTLLLAAAALALLLALGLAAGLFATRTSSDFPSQTTRQRAPATQRPTESATPSTTAPTGGARTAPARTAPAVTQPPAPAPPPPPSTAPTAPTPTETTVPTEVTTLPETAPAGTTITVP